MSSSSSIQNIASSHSHLREFLPNGSGMMKRSFTILVVPHTGEQFRKLRLTSGGLRALTVSVALVAVAALFLAAHYVAFYRDLGELRELRVNHSELKRQNLHLKN